MKKILILLLSLTLSLFGYSSVKKLKFESGITIYGQVGFVEVELRENFDTNTYEMIATTTSIGAVKYLTNNRRDIFTSEGQIRDGVYIPFRFTKEAKKTDYHKITSYFFDYEENIVHKTVSLEKYENVSTFDPVTFSYKKEKKRIQEKDETTVKLYKNDYLSLYLNMKKGNLKIGQVYYVDRKDDDQLYYRNEDLIEVHKNGGEDKYKIVIHHDKESVFFKKVESVGVSFYGDAYIQKVSESTDIIDNSALVHLN